MWKTTRTVNWNLHRRTPQWIFFLTLFFLNTLLLEFPSLFMKIRVAMSYDAGILFHKTKLITQTRWLSIMFSFNLELCCLANKRFCALRTVLASSLNLSLVSCLRWSHRKTFVILVVSSANFFNVHERLCFWRSQLLHTNLVHEKVFTKCK